MSTPVAIPVPRRPELLFSRLGERGAYVVKDPHSGDYYHFGEQEHYLLTQLDGKQSSELIRTSFADRFHEPLSDTDLEEFLTLAGSRGLLQPAASSACFTPEGSKGSCHGAAVQPGAACRGARRCSSQGLLCWRFRLFDPDRLFAWLLPKMRFFWTRPFFAVSAVSIVAATVLVWANRQELVSSFAQTLSWRTAVLVWFVLLATTTCHEFAHGLTCKRHGGEVHEVGFLLLFFIPGFYCNVSDAWLIPEKSKRLWVTFAGAYFDLFQWALAVFIWRLSVQDSLINYLAFVAVSVIGGRIFFNLNPLLKLDGYYLLSDLAELPNLRQRGMGRFAAVLRHWFWGAPRPEPEQCGRFLVGFGLASWLFSVVFLTLMFVGLGRFLGAHWGLAGSGAAAILWIVITRRLFQGLLGGEVRNMIASRHRRSIAWVFGLGTTVAALCYVQIEDRAGGPFQIRPATRAEVRAPVAGFLQTIEYDEGDVVSPGHPIARFEIPDLDSRLAQKRAEVREVQAKLRLLEAGSRPEEIREQRLRVERSREWRDLAEQDLTRSRQALAEQLADLDHQNAEYKAELDFSERMLATAENLQARKALAAANYEESKKKHQIAKAQWEQILAKKRALQAIGTREAEAELARRQKELADAQATLALLEAGTRPEEVEAERARLARMQEEARYLEGLKGKLLVHSPFLGVVTTPRLKEKAGQYLREGDLICQVEPTAVVEAEIALNQEDVNRIETGQRVLLKARALPFEAIAATVTRIAPTVVSDQVKGTATVVCRLDEPGSGLRSGMTGHARIYATRRPIGEIALDRVLRFLRTEFWW